MKWQYKVVKQMRGMHGEWFDFPTAATFDDESDARVYAEQFAREQGAAGVSGARIDVRSRKKRLNEAGWLTHHVVTYKSDDYLPKAGA